MALYKAGLLAGVNSAFLALALPEMTASPADDTDALLLQLVTGDNSTMRTADDLPSASFTPSPNIVPVNILFSLSLTLALIASFLAVLAQQWLVYYRKRSGGGADYQRWEQLRRYLGPQRWRLEAIWDDVLPALLQLALVIFCVAFVLYLRTLSKTIYYVIAIPMAVAMTILLLMAIMAFLDQWCPFQSPLSHFLQLAGRFVQRHRRVWLFILALTSIPVLLSVLAVYITLRARQLARKAKIFLARRLWTGYPVPLEFRPSLESFGEDAMDIVIRACSFRSGETTTHLQTVAAKRVLCTSEEFNALVYTAINIQAITESECAEGLLDDDAVHERLGELSESREEAGLFAGVNSAFLALTLPDMKADPADDTNALLLQLVIGGNSSIHSADDLPSAIFTPSPAIFPINVLFSLSLTLAIISSFLAVLGQQWLVYYRKRSGGGAEHQRWEQLRRYLGAKRWRLEAILDDILPALLQLSLPSACSARQDFNALIFTATNIQAMEERESIQCLLDEDTVHRRLEESLGGSREAALASVFSRAFPHLLLGSCSTALFVEQDTRSLYSKGTLYPKKHEYVVEKHPLKEKVEGVWAMSWIFMGSPTAQSDFIGLKLCFEFLVRLLREDSSYLKFWLWVDDFVEQQPAWKLASLTVIKFVARAINAVHPWPDSATGTTVKLRRGEPVAVWEQRPGEPYEHEEDLQERYLTVQQQRAEAFKMIIDVDWEMLVGSTISKTHDVWLLDQLLLMLNMLNGKPNARNWSLVTRASIDLLCWFDEFEHTVSNSIATQDSRKDNRLRCTRALFECLQAIENDDSIWLGSISLDKLVEHLERVVERGLDQSADSYHVPILATWLKIRDLFGEASKLRDHWRYWDGYFEEFEEVYPRLRRALDAIEAAIQDIPTVSNVDLSQGNPADPPPLPTDGVRFDQMGFNNGAAEVVTSKSEAAAPGTLVPTKTLQTPGTIAGFRRVGRATNTSGLQMTSQNQWTTKKSDQNDLKTL
ncbi:hypothetical protein FS837_013053 [Tulasnella sp. UAMH 9824]|nr:hypothetical protein FS837_013053 [Tulasnella sp. UAMH 9824]